MTKLIEVSNNTIIVLEAINASITEGAKLKDVKQSLADLIKENSLSLSGFAVECFTPEFTLYGLVNAMKAKHSSKDKLSGYLTNQAIKILEALEAMEVSITIDEVSEEEPAIDWLEQVSNDIHQHLSDAKNSYIEVGRLLTEAREEFEGQKAFIVWTTEQFNIKKSQAFRLMRIFKEFGNVGGFEGVAMRVLDILCGESQEVKEKAAKLVKEGELDTPTAKLLVEEDKPTEELTEEETDIVTPDFIEEGVVIEEEAEKPTLDEAMVKAMNKMQATIDSLTKQLEEANKPKRVQKLPMLPHFQSNCMATRLGLDDKINKEAVRSAYRNTVKHYTKEANEEVFNLLTEALEFFNKGFEAASKA